MVLDLITTFTGFLAGPFGLSALLIGLVSFAMLGVPSRIGQGERGANTLLSLAQTAAGRGAIVVSEADEVFYKQMTYKDVGLFEISFKDGVKQFEDTTRAVHRWLGNSLTLADEKHGVCFDPRFAAVGKRKREAEEREELYFKSTDAENSSYGVRGWVRGVFQLPQNYELVELGQVRSLISGGERAEYGPRVTELYKFSREPYRSSKAIIRLLIPPAAFLGTLGGMWLIADQASGASSTVSFGVLWLLLAIPSTEAVKDRLGAVDWGRLAKITAAVVTPVAIVAGLAVALSPLVAGMMTVAWVLGFVALPVLMFLTKFSNKVSGAFANLFFKLGLLGYERPVFVWTPERYELREYDELEDVNSTTWYGLGGQTVGFTFTPEVDSFEEGWTAEDVKNASELAADGGADTNLPPGYTRSEALRRDVYGGFVPSRPKKSRIYVKAGRFMRRLAPAATGNKSKESLEDAREKYGLGWMARVEGKTLAYLTFAAMLVAAIIGTWAFFL